MNPRPELISFTDKDGRVSMRFMVPVLDDMGNVTGWKLPDPQQTTT